MTAPIDIAALRRVIANRGECAGPRTTFPEPGRADVTILCGRNYVEVIEWLAVCVHALPAALDEIERLRDVIVDERAQAARDADSNVIAYESMLAEVRAALAEAERERDEPKLHVNAVIDEECERVQRETAGLRRVFDA